MVRKRTRKYESDDNSDSDVDFDVETTREPAPKKYSLRERKSVPSMVEFDYYGLDDEEEARKHSSDDEDFEVEADVETTRAYFEPSEDADPQNSDGLIDFEDIIRADIVVNKNKIDYDNIIQKTEIKLTPAQKKRGRKPKNQVKDEDIKDEPETEQKQEMVAPEAEAPPKLETNNEIEEKESCNGKVVMVSELMPEVSCDEIDVIEKQSEIDPLALKNVTNGEMSGPEPPLIIEGLPNEGGDNKIEEEDDDVIVLGELKQDVIVLDD